MDIILDNQVNMSSESGQGIQVTSHEWRMLLSKDMNLGAIKATPPNDMGGESRYLPISTARQAGRWVAGKSRTGL